MSLALGEIGQIAINVRDLSKAARFYREVLRMEFLFDAPGMVFFQCGAIRLMLGQTDQAEAASSILYYRVDDIDAAYDTLKDRGVDFIQPPVIAHKAETYDLWLAFFRDVDQNTLALMTEKPR